jgi:hypothetical protein
VLRLLVVGAVGAFVVSGPLQHVGVLPKTAVGDASKSFIRFVLNRSVEPAFAGCPGGGLKMKGNNGFGNGGLDGVPGKSGSNNAPNAGQKEADQVR